MQSIPSLITKTDYKASYFIKLLDLKAPTYYRKLRDNAFTTDEVFTLTKALFPKEAFKEELLASLSKGRDDFKNGNVISSEEVRKEMREKIQSYQ
tara:strand:+ start:270 stop:554 length:285 start_codon:yes stop_codon:yes gene_type:complete